MRTETTVRFDKDEDAAEIKVLTRAIPSARLGTPDGEDDWKGLSALAHLASCQQTSEAVMRRAHLQLERALNAALEQSVASWWLRNVARPSEPESVARAELIEGATTQGPALIADPVKFAGAMAENRIAQACDLRDAFELLGRALELYPEEVTA